MARFIHISNTMTEDDLNKVIEIVNDCKAIGQDIKVRVDITDHDEAISVLEKERDRRAS